MTPQANSRPALRAAVRIALFAFVPASLMNVGCTFFPTPIFGSFRCSMTIRSQSRPEISLRLSNQPSAGNPLSFGSLTGCSTPASLTEEQVWRRFVNQRLGDICAAGSSASAEVRMMFCQVSDWCIDPASLPGCPDSRATPPPGSCPMFSVMAELPQCTTVAPAPRLIASRTSVTFPSTELSTAAATETVTLTNSGTGTLRVGQPALTAPVGSMMSFSIAASTCGPAMAGGPDTMLGAGASCTINLGFRPEPPAGAKMATLRVPYNDGATRNLDLPVSGTAAASTVTFGCTTPAPGIAGALCFNRRVGACFERTFNLNSTGTLRVTGIALPAGYTRLAPAALPATAAAGAPLSVRVQNCMPLPSAGFITINTDSGPFRIEIQPPTSGCMVPAGCG